jgi:tRNA 2-thiouridine synthesizing protein A
MPGFPAARQHVAGTGGIPLTRDKARRGNGRIISICSAVDGAEANVRSLHRYPGAIAMNFDKELDARGLSCPLPILKTKKALNDLTSGQVLKVVATDPGSIKDMQAFATQTGNALLSTEEADKTYVFFLKKK